jgi:hypothetical protein
VIATLSLENSIFGLEVSVDDAASVQVRRGVQQLTDQPSGFLFTQLATRGDSIEELPAIEMLQDEVHKRRRFIHVLQLDDKWVIK